MANPLTPLPDGLLPSALRAADSRGRCHDEPAHPFRSIYQRDRDRVIHSAAFRRLEYKTQVFVNGEGDNYRTRLTHTLEVSQIGRTIARTLCLNEDFAEAVALSHDLGHTPFGHAGERLLNDLLAACGGFEHNAQGLRVVDMLENRYAAFAGLNLTYEVRKAFLSHAGGADHALPPGFIPGEGALLEVEATMAADDIAYIAHDIDDGLYSGMLAGAELGKQELWREATAGLDFASLPPSLRRTEGVRRLINLLVVDIVDSTRANIVRLGLDSLEKVKKKAETAVGFSTTIEKKKNDLKAFLYSNFYRHPELMEVIGDAQNMMRAIFAVYVTDVNKMPLEYRSIAEREGRLRAVADYVAGMTDRFAREEYTKLFGRERKAGKK